MIKGVLKALFPRTFLKKAFLVYNQIKATTWDKVFFKKAAIEDELFLVSEKKNPFLELSIDVTHFDRSVQDKLAIWTNPQWSQDQYLLDYRKPGFIEPHVGWAMTTDRELIYPSLGFSSAPHVHKPNWFEVYFKKPATKKLDKVISLRDTGEENYFHFFNDVLPKLFLLQEQGIEVKDYTIILSERLYQKHYFQYYLKHSFLKYLNWHIQECNEWISFNEAFFCKSFTHCKRYLDYSVSTLSINQGLNGERKIFLTRSNKSLRFIENFKEVEIILTKYGFDVIDASQLTFTEQINLFCRCRYLVAIHGAGITNIIFRSGEPLSLLEIIHPSPYIPFHYIMLCKLYNYSYSALLGQKGKQQGDGGFEVKIQELEQKIINLLQG